MAVSTSHNLEVSDAANAVRAEGIVVEDLQKHFLSPTGRPIDVLRGVSFSVAAGEIVAVMGASGAGKSTLLHLLGGLEAADGGTVQMTPTVGKSPVEPLASQRNVGIGFIFQFHYLLPDLTATENVAMPLMIARVPRNESLRRAALALEKIGLESRLEHLIGNLSGGEQQRVAVARALITNPKLVLADEPTGNLDGSLGDEIAGLLVNYCREKGAVGLVATHNDQLAKLCDRVLFLENGQIR